MGSEMCIRDSYSIEGKRDDFLYTNVWGLIHELGAAQTTVTRAMNTFIFRIQQLFFTTMVEAHCARGKRANANQWLIGQI